MSTETTEAPQWKPDPAKEAGGQRQLYETFCSGFCETVGARIIHRASHIPENREIILASLDEFIELQKQALIQGAEESKEHFIKVTGSTDYLETAKARGFDLLEKFKREVLEAVNKSPQTEA